MQASISDQTLEEQDPSSDTVESLFATTTEVYQFILSVTGNVTKKEGKIFSLRLIKKNL